MKIKWAKFTRREKDMESRTQVERLTSERTVLYQQQDEEEMDGVEDNFHNGNRY